MKQLLCGVLTTLACMTFAQEPGNLASNAGFEDLTEHGFATDWRGGEFGKPGENVTVDKTVAHSGTSSAKVGISPGSFVTCAGASIPVKPNTTYYVSWWCKTEGMKLARGYLFLQTNKGQRVFDDMNQVGTTDWTRHLGQYTTTEDETSLHPVLTTHDQGGPECFAWFDDVGVYEGSFPPELKTAWDAYLRNLSGISETAILLSKTPGLTVWADNLSARIYREDGLPDYAKPAQRVELAAARGEEEFFQLSIRL